MTTFNKGDIVKVVQDNTKEGDTSITKYIHAIGTIIGIRLENRYPYEISFQDPLLSIQCFMASELTLALNSSNIERRIKQLYAKCKTTSHWSVNNDI